MPPNPIASGNYSEYETAFIILNSQKTLLLFTKRIATVKKPVQVSVAPDEFFSISTGQHFGKKPQQTLEKIKKLLGKIEARSGIQSVLQSYSGFDWKTYFLLFKPLDSI